MSRDSSQFLLGNWLTSSPVPGLLLVQHAEGQVAGGLAVGGGPDEVGPLGGRGSHHSGQVHPVSQSDFLLKVRGLPFRTSAKISDFLTPPVRKFTQFPLLRLLTIYVCF